MKILLIQPPMTVLPNEIKSVTFPLGLAYIAAYLEKKGHDINVMDCVALGQDTAYNEGKLIHFGLSWNEIEARIRKINPDAVGISCLFSSQSGNTHKVAAIVKKANRKIPVVVGGAHASSLPRDVLKDRNIDAAVLGEGEVSCSQYIDSLQGKYSIESIDGIAYRKNNEIIVQPKTKYIKNIDELPQPARHL